MLKILQMIIQVESLNHHGTKTWLILMKMQNMKLKIVKILLTIIQAETKKYFDICFNKA